MSAASIQPTSTIRSPSCIATLSLPFASSTSIGLSGAATYFGPHPVSKALAAANDAHHARARRELEQRLEDGADDRIDHRAPASSLVTPLSRAKIRPRPAMHAAMSAA